MKIGLTCLIPVVLVGLTVTGWANSVSISAQNVSQQQQQQQQSAIEGGPSGGGLSGTLEGEGFEKQPTKREIFEKRISHETWPVGLAGASSWAISILLGLTVAIIGLGGGYELKKKSRLWYPVVGLMYLVGSAGGLFVLFMVLGPFLAEAGACWPICNRFGPL